MNEGKFIKLIPQCELYDPGKDMLETENIYRKEECAVLIIT